MTKPWLLSTYQGSVDKAYLDEFVFWFNGRRSRSRGLIFCRLLELAVEHYPVYYDDIVTKRERKPRL